jgi:tRNA nucleotidyltransferase (CCA-adding enzyme)
VDRLFGVPQAPEFHPEIDTGLHVLLAMNMAARLGASPEATFALLLHDLGKGLTPVADLPAHAGHEERGVPLVDAVCTRLRAPGSYRELALTVCALHLRVHRLGEMQPRSVMRLIEDADLLRRPERLRDLLEACEADYRGRTGREDRAYPQAARLRAALQAVQAVQARHLDVAGLSGEQIGARLREARIAAIARVGVTAGSAGPAG